MRTAGKVLAFSVGVTTLGGAGYGLYKLGQQSGSEKPAEPKTVAVQASAEAGAALTALKHTSDWAAFEKFMAEFGRKYASEEETLAKFEIFVANLRVIEAHNAKDNGVTLAVNDFADVKPEHFKAERLGLNARPADMKSLYKNLGTFKASGMKVPDSVDWREKGAVTPVKNQGQCGSCWSFSTTGALEGRNFVATNKLCSLSEQQFVDCDTKNDHGCNGGLMDFAFQFAESHSLCSEESFPYSAKDGKCPADLESTCDVCIKKGEVTGFQDVQTNDVDAMKEALSQGPVSVAIEADQAVFQFYKSGVVTSAECGNQLDHGVLAVGYGSQKNSAGEDQPYFIVKNSWGAQWGVEGYVKISAKLSSSGLSECGILAQPSFPVISKQSFPEENKARAEKVFV